MIGTNEICDMRPTNEKRDMRNSRGLGRARRDIAPRHIATPAPQSDAGRKRATISSGGR